jgi:hypothetical protein
LSVVSFIFSTHIVSQQKGRFRVQERSIPASGILGMMPGLLNRDNHTMTINGSNDDILHSSIE